MPTDRPQRWVLLETAPWGHRLRLPGHHLATWLADRGHRVAYVSAPISPWHFLSARARPLALQRWRREPARGQWRTPNLFTIIPRTLAPIHRLGPLDSEFTWKNAAALTIPNLQATLAAQGFHEPDVLVVHNLQTPGLIKSLRPRTLVARVEDDIAGFRDMPQVIVRREADVLRRADLVTITAEALRERIERDAEKPAYLLRNGVDFARFRRPDTLPPRPADMPPGPVALYNGTLDHWFDDAMVMRAAAAMPDWSFVIIGPHATPMTELRRVPNVHFLGQRAYEELPAYAWHADAGMIPFKRLPLIESVCPLKVFEYCAAGLPVVATRWRELETLQSPALLVESDTDFQQSLVASLKVDSDTRARAIEWASAFDWDRLFTDFAARVDEVRL